MQAHTRQDLEREVQQGGRATGRRHNDHRYRAGARPLPKFVANDGERPRIRAASGAACGLATRSGHFPDHPRLACFSAG